jgi:hypothetical protein
MSRWFRFYDAALDDPKVQALPGELFKAWVNLLCIASKCDGKIVASDVSFRLRMDSKKVVRTLTALAEAGLVDLIEGGYEPHNWRERQYKSDSSAERVKKFRERKANECNVTETVTVTPPETEADTETDSERKKGIGADAPNVLEFTGGRYEFEGETIKATPATMKRFREECPNLPDLTAQLRIIDAYYTHEKPLPDPTKWFFPTYRWLQKENGEAKAKRREATRGVDWW